MNKSHTNIHWDCCVLRLHPHGEGNIHSQRNQEEEGTNYEVGWFPKLHLEFVSLQLQTWMILFLGKKFYMKNVGMADQLKF